MNDGERIYVAGHTGLVGSAILRHLQRTSSAVLLTRTRAELDLTQQAAVDRFFAVERPTHVYLAAARVGGILDNARHPGDFIRDNLAIQSNVIDAAHRHGARKLLFLGSSCIYPKLAPQPMRPEHLMSGPLEVTNRAYATAKLAGIEMCRSYRLQYGFNAISTMPTNLYGPEDNLDPEAGHVIPALLRRFIEAKVQHRDEVVIWGTGAPRREFLYIDDVAEALVTVMQRYNGDAPINVGSGEDISIRKLAEMIQRIIGFDGAIRFDHSKPDGTPRKLLDVEPMFALGWRPRVGLEEGLRRTAEWVRHRLANA